MEALIAWRCASKVNIYLCNSSIIIIILCNHGICRSLSCPAGPPAILRYIYIAYDCRQLVRHIREYKIVGSNSYSINDCLFVSSRVHSLSLLTSPNPYSVAGKPCVRGTVHRCSSTLVSYPVSIPIGDQHVALTLQTNLYDCLSFELDQCVSA